jgi:hypothetical protein
MIKIEDIIIKYLELLNVRRAHRVGIILSIRNNFADNIKQILDDYIPQEGGSKIPPKFDLSKGKPILMETKVKKVDITYNNLNYSFEMTYDDDLVNYHLYRDSKEDEKSIKECILVQVNKKKKTCNIQSITYDKSCIPRLEMNNKGSTLLKIALKLINTIKDRYKIERIELTDNSKKTCNGWKLSVDNSKRKNQSSNDSFKKEIRLGIMSTLLFGTTWYGKYGFYPKDKEYKEYFDENKKTMEKTMLADIPQLKELIIKAHKKSESKLDLQSILRSYDKALDKKASLQSFLNWFFKEYDNRCIIFYYFYRELYRELKLTDMYGETFVKDI